MRAASRPMGVVGSESHKICKLIRLLESWQMKFCCIYTYVYVPNQVSPIPVCVPTPDFCQPLPNPV